MQEILARFSEVRPSFLQRNPHFPFQSSSQKTVAWHPTPLFPTPPGCAGSPSLRLG